MRWIIEGIIVAGLVVAGCSMEAKIRMNNGRVYEGKITGSDEKYIYMSAEKIEREEIRDIDHPGNVMGGAGAVIAGIFGMTTAVCAGKWIQAGRADIEMAGTLFSSAFFIPGVIMTVWGFSIWLESKKAAEWERTVKVVMHYDGSGGYAGLVVWW